MGVKALPLYQGGDWFTYRWPVAQVFDTLDHIGNLCHLRSWDDAEIGQPDVHGILDAILHLSHDVAGELDLAEADIFKKPSGSASVRWACFEMCQKVLLLRSVAQKAEALDPSTLFEDLETLVTEIKDTLRKLDKEARL